MSTNGLLNISGLDGNAGNGSGQSLPGGIDKSVQFNDGGLLFGGTSNFLYDSDVQTLSVNKIKPTAIIDNLNTTGVNGQVLKSTGTGIRFVNEVGPAAPDTSVQYNKSGVFSGDSDFTFDDTSNTLSVTNIQSTAVVTSSVKPTTIIDNVNSVGTSGQVLKSTGTGIVFANEVAPGAPVNSVQFNNAGAFGGDSNFVFNSTTDVLNVNGNVGIGSLSAPTDRLVVTGANSTIRVKSTTVNNANLVLEDSSSGVKQLAMSVNVDTADFTSIQQGVSFRNFRFNPTSSTSCISSGTTGAQAIGGFMCSNALSNRKVVLYSISNDEHRNHSIGVNTDTFRFQIPVHTSDRFAWFAGTSTGTSNELMRLTGTGNLGIGTTSANAQLQLSNTPSNRKIVLFETVNNEHQIFGLGINTSTFRFQIDNTANRYAWFAGVNASSSNELMRLNGNGTLSIGNTNSTFPLEVTGTIRSTSSRPNTILDTSNAAGTAGQLLSSTGTAIQWVNPVGPAGSTNQVQYNNGGVFGASTTFTFDPTIDVLSVSQINTNVLLVSQINANVIRPVVIEDFSFSSGTAGQILSSTGTDIQWINAPVATSPAGSDQFVQYNDSGSFGASTNFRWINSTNTLSAPNINATLQLVTPSAKPATIVDTTNSTGTAGQLLSSTGSSIQWVNPPTGTVPAGSDQFIQYNNSGSFGASTNFRWINATNTLYVGGAVNTSVVTAQNINATLNLAVGTSTAAAPRIFAQSGSANSVVSSWNDQWIMAGGGSGAANSAGIGIGYDNTNVRGIIACSEPSTGYKPIVFSASRYEFRTNNVIRMSVDTTGTGDGVVIVPVLQATNIFDGTNTVGTNGQFLSSTGTGLLWKSAAPYCTIINGTAPAGGFSSGTGTPPIGTAANAAFPAFPRTSSYRISTSVTGYSGGAGTVNNMQIWYRTTNANPWNLLHTHQLYFNNALFHLSYPTKSSIISISAGNPLQILVRALTPNTASDNNDFFNIDILECTV
jgi:alpha-D-ribose 1-methylphosphonate 5-triphosphate synthase subunit PhnH